MFINRDANLRRVILGVHRRTRARLLNRLLTPLVSWKKSARTCGLIMNSPWTGSRSVRNCGAAGRPRLLRGGASRLLSANPCLEDLPVRVVLGSELPPSLVGVGDTTSFRRQRHQQQQA